MCFDRHYKIWIKSYPSKQTIVDRQTDRETDRQADMCSGVAIGWAAWTKSRRPPNVGGPRVPYNFFKINFI